MDAADSETLEFQCNICAARSQTPLASLGRETPSCSICRSTPRVRAIVDILARQLLGESLPLPEFPLRRDLRGLGLTDSHNYAQGLAEKFDYENTFLHQAPVFDITAPLAPEQVGAYDFVVSSEIFEHVLPPVARAFENVFGLLKPGGLFLLTVPYSSEPETREHFPDLHDFSVTKESGKYVLSNQTRSGVLQRYHDLVFHAGPGSTLEMRVFGSAALAQNLDSAGFREVTFHHENTLRFGIFWRQTWSRPISARKPAL